MSIKIRKGFCAKLGAPFLWVTLLAASLSLSALPSTEAQSMGDTPSASGSEPNSDSSKGSASTSDSITDSESTSDSSTSRSTTSTTSATTTAPTPDAASATTSSSTSTTTTAAPTSDIPPGVLWTDPKYAVKEMPAARVPLPTSPRPTTGTKGSSAAVTTAKPSDVNPTSYDDKDAKIFADSLSMTQYVWTRQDKETKGQKVDALNASKEMAAYNRFLVEKFVANMTVPSSATLVENSSSQYVYLLSFTIDAKGKINNINPEKSFGPFKAVTLADDGENGMMIASMTKALAKCSPVKVPPGGVPPWYMLLKYEPNTGKVFIANMNSI